MLDTALNPEICEFVGAFIGDGHFGRYGKGKTTYTVGLVGHQTLDAEYLKYLAEIIKKNFPDTKPRIYDRKDENTLRVIVNSKKLYYFLENLGFRSKNKSKNAIIPKPVLNDERFLKATIRGIFDTDGSFFVDKRPVYITPYPRIDLHLENKELIKQVHLLLLSMNVPSTITKQHTKVQINGKIGISKFMEEIGFSNNKHLSKIKALAEI